MMVQRSPSSAAKSLLDTKPGMRSASSNTRDACTPYSSSTPGFKRFLKTITIMTGGWFSRPQRGCNAEAVCHPHEVRQTAKTLEEEPWHALCSQERVI
jgi:hypothetical protein